MCSPTMTTAYGLPASELRRSVRGRYLFSERVGDVQLSAASPGLGEPGNWLSSRHLSKTHHQESRSPRFSSIACKWHSSCTPGYRRNADLRIQQPMTS